MLCCFVLGISVLSGAPGAEAVLRATPCLSAVTESLTNNNSNEPSTESAVALAYRADVLKKAFLKGDENEIQSAVNEVDLLRGDYETLDVTPLVEALCLWAKDLGEEGSVETGSSVLTQISRWAPEHPALLGTQAILHKKKSPAGYFQNLTSMLKLSQVRLENPTSRCAIILRHTGWLKLAATIALWGLALALTLKYRRYFRHILERPVAGALGSSNGAAFIAALILTIPVILGLDPSFNAFLWLLLLTPALTAPELKIAIFCTLIQLAHPAVSLAEIKFPISDAYTGIEALQTQPQLISSKARPLNKLTPQDQQFLMGWGALRSGDAERAEQIFQTLSSRSFERAASLNNLGVALQRQGKYDAALKVFIEANEADPSAIEPVYNEALIDFVTLDTAEAESYLASSRKINLAAYEQMASLVTSRSKQTFPMPIKNTPERSKALADSYKQTYINNYNFAQNNSLDLTDIIWTVWPLVGAAALIIRKNASKAQYQCVECGNVFQDTHSPNQNVCSQCHHLLFLKDISSVEDRAKKMVKINAFDFHQKWIYKTLKIIMPGCDHIFLGSTLPGFTLFAVLTASVGMVIQLSGDMYYPGEIIHDPPSIFLAVGALSGAMLYLHSWLKLLLNSLKRSKK